MRAAKTDEEFAAVVMELPDRPLEEMSEEDREFFIMEQKIESECSFLFIPNEKRVVG